MYTKSKYWEIEIENIKERSKYWRCVTKLFRKLNHNFFLSENLLFFYPFHPIDQKQTQERSFFIFFFDFNIFDMIWVRIPINTLGSRNISYTKNVLVYFYLYKKSTTSAVGFGKVCIDKTYICTHNR